jgi:CBS domain-containing protein
VPTNCLSRGDRREEPRHTRGNGCVAHDPLAGATRRWVGLDGAKLVGQVGDVTDVGIADRMRQCERALRSGDLDDRGDIDVSVRNQLPAPVPIGMDLRVCSSSAGNAGDYKRGERQGRLVVGQETLRISHIDLNKAVHRRRSFAGPQCGTNDATIPRKRSHHDLPWAIRSHGMTLPRFALKRLAVSVPTAVYGCALDDHRDELIDHAPRCRWGLRRRCGDPLPAGGGRNDATVGADWRPGVVCGTTRVKKPIKEVTMTTAKEIMHTGVACVGEHETLTAAAQHMRDLDVGALPIRGDDGHLHGMVTDRDVVI